MLRDPKILECPNCLATLDPGTSKEPFVKCAYCGASVQIRPEEPPKPEAPKLSEVMQSRRERRISPPPSHTPPSKTKTWHIVLTVAIIISAGTGVLAGALYLGKHHLENKPGNLYSAHVARLKGGGEVLVLLSSFRDEEHSYQRMLSVDPRTGKRLARKLFKFETTRLAMTHSPWRPQLLPAAPGSLWAVIHGKLQLRDAKTLALKTGADQPGVLTPALSAGVAHSELMGWDVVVDGWSGAAIVTTKQGEQIRIDPATLRGRPYQPGKEEVLLPHSSGRVSLAAVKAKLTLRPKRLREGDEHVTIRNDHRLPKEQKRLLVELPRLRRLGHSKYGGGSRLATTKQGQFLFQRVKKLKFRLHRREPGQRAFVPLDPTVIFLSPAFLENYGSNSPMELPDDAGFLVAHRSDMDIEDSHPLISLVTPAGKKVWTVPFAGTLHATHRIDDILVVASEGGKMKAGYAQGIVWRTGKARWTQTF